VVERVLILILSRTLDRSCEMMQRSFVVFVVALVGALLLCSSRVNAVSDTDIAALRALYEATNGDQWVRHDRVPSIARSLARAKSRSLG